jgi:DNA-binding NarL/FixJ family response regulator
MSSATTKVLIYDSSSLQCELLSTALQSLRQGLEVESASDYDSMSALLATDANWVLIISDNNSGGATPSIARRLRTDFSGLALVFLLQEGQTDRVIEAFRLGARGIVYSNENLAQLARCIDRVSQGEVWVRHVDLGIISEQLARSGGRVTDVAGKVLLSPREEEISRLVAEGMSNREVSRTLRISESTVKNSLFHVFDKLGISNRVELARYVNLTSEQHPQAMRSRHDTHP